MSSFTLIPGTLTVADLRRFYENPLKIQLNVQCLTGIKEAMRTVADILSQGKAVYGINTGFGLLANTRIDDNDLLLLQRNLVLSHACGTGVLLTDQQVRLVLLLKINSLARGFSGVRVTVIEALIELLNAEVYPCIPRKGSVGASGDLAPLAHMSAALLGVGKVRVRGEVLPAFEGLAIAGLQPIVLGPKEGLALLNGTQASTAVALSGLFSAERLFNAALLTGGLSVDAALGSDAPFDDRIHKVRGHPGQRDVAKVFRNLLLDSEIRLSHSQCERVQDPYSLRCQPQVMGACLDNLRHAAIVLCREANAVSDNPLVFHEQQQILSGGNFHAEPVAIVADLLAICIAEIGALSERRIALLIDGNLSSLPPFLVHNGGLNSGFMIAHVTAAAMASENKSLSHPASVDSLPTSANQEDHVSMSMFAAYRLGEMSENTAGILAVELLVGCQGVEMRSPLKSSPILQKLVNTVRQEVDFYEADRFFATDISCATKLVKCGLLRTDIFPSITL